MEVLVAIAGKVAEYSVAPVGRLLGYLLFYRSNVKNLEAEVKKLQNIRERVQHDIDSATWDAQEIEPDVTDWIDKVDEIIGKATAFHEDDKVSGPNLSQRHRLSKTAKKMALEVKEIRVEGKFDRVGYYSAPQGMRPSQRAKDYKDLALELSYGLLQSEEHRSMFLLIGFLGRYYINKYSLFIYMWSGFFKNLDTLEDARNRLNNLTSDLKASSLLLEDGEEWIAMHDMVKEVSASIATRDLRASKFDIRQGWPQMDTIKKCRLLYLPPSNLTSLPARLEAPELQVFILEQQTQDMQVPDTFFENTRDLKVLDLVYLKFTPMLPSSLSYLKNLRALSFFCCNLEDMAGVGELENLQILSLLGSTIHQLPREIEKLHKLQFLNLDDCVHLKVIPAKALSNLTKLEELQTRNTNIDWNVEGSGSENGNASLNELGELHHLKWVDLNIPNAEVWPVDLILEKLERFRILIGHGWDSNCVSNSKTLKLKLTRSIQNEHGIKMLVKNVDNLYLDELDGVENVLYDLNSEGFPLLKFLMVQNNVEIKCIVMSLNDPLRAFPNLESLSLYNLSSLELICQGNLTRESFRKLKIVEIKCCEKLVTVFPASLLRYLRNLETLMVSSCSSVEAIFDLEEPNDIREFSGTSNQLRSLSFVQLPKLKHIWTKTDLHGIFNLQNLGSLHVKACPNLKYVFPVSEAKNLAKLKDPLIESPSTDFYG